MGLEPRTEQDKARETGHGVSRKQDTAGPDEGGHESPTQPGSTPSLEAWRKAVLVMRLGRESTWAGLEGAREASAQRRTIQTMLLESSGVGEDGTSKAVSCNGSEDRAMWKTPHAAEAGPLVNVRAKGSQRM